MKKIIKIDLDIYPSEKVIDAIKDFSDVALIELKNNELEISWETESEIEEIFLEFWNYVIWLINE